MTKRTRRGLFSLLRDTAKPPATPAPKPWVGLRDIRPKGEGEAPQMAVPAETALSAEMQVQAESAPPWKTSARLPDGTEP